MPGSVTAGKVKWLLSLFSPLMAVLLDHFGKRFFSRVRSIVLMFLPISSWVGPKPVVQQRVDLEVIRITGFSCLWIFLTVCTALSAWPLPRG